MEKDTLVLRAFEGEDDDKEMALLGGKASRVLLERFSSYLVDELGRRPNTAQGYVWYIKRAEKSIGKPAHRINADDLRWMLRETDYALSTKRGIIVAFHQFHAYGVMAGLWKLNGISQLKTPKVPKDPKAPLRAEDAHRLLAHSTSPVQVRTAYLGLYAGLRIQESSGIREHHWLGDTLIITPEIAKAGKKRKVPVHPEVAKMKQYILSHSPSKGTCGTMFTVMRDRLELKDREGNRATPHTLRRTFASTIYDKGAPYEVVQKCLGHGADVTALYVTIEWDRMVKAVELASYWDGVPVQMELFV